MFCVFFKGEIVKMVKSMVCDRMPDPMDKIVSSCTSVHVIIVKYMLCVMPLPIII